MKLPLVFIISYFVLQLPSVSSRCSGDCPCGATCCFLLEENSPPDTVVGTYNGGESEPYKWSMASEHFSINSTTGVITTTEVLDRESTFVQSLRPPDYCIILTLAAGPQMSLELLAVQVVDVNDNPPIFNMPSYTVNVPESEDGSLTPSDCEKFRQLIDIRIDDADEGNNSRTIYSIEDSNQFFYLPMNNSPCVLGRGLDRDNPPSTYSVILVAEDEGNSSLRSTANVTFILEDINDNAPYFVGLDSNITVNEDRRNGDVVYTFAATDLDSGTYGKEGIRYAIEPTNFPFTINATSGELTLTGEIDAEQTNKYMLEVIASDNEGRSGGMSSRTSFTVCVADVNELGMVQVIDTSLNLDVAEDVPKNSGILIAAIVLVDGDETEENRRNGNVALISSDPDRFYVTVVPQMQRFFYSLFLNGTFDREKESTVTVVVNLTEGGNPTLYHSETFTVTVLDVNDNDPILNKTEFDVIEGQRVEIDLSSYTYDKDNGTNGTISSYQLIRATGKMENFTEKFKKYFTSSGELIIPELDREEVGSRVVFVVNITDAGHPPKWKLYDFVLNVEDVNDNSPTFTSTEYTFHVPENSAARTPVGQVVATDQDEGSNRQVVYMLSPQVNNFSIDNMTGWILTERKFDHEGSDSSSLTVVAANSVDGGRMTSSVTVTILIDDVNDNDPVFVEERKMFKIAVSKRVGELVGQVVATDADSDAGNKVIVYQIEGLNEHFTIAPNTSGDITLKAPILEPGSFMFNVSAFNPGREEYKSTILITVMANPGGLSTTLVIVVSATGSFFLVLIVVVVLLLIFIIWKNKKSKRQLKLHQDVDRMDTQVSILKIPANVNGTAGKSIRVTFKERVEETHYDGESSVINSTTSTFRKESVTKFDGSPQVLREDERVTISPQPPSPVSSNGKPSGLTVVELEMSPRQPMNGDINGRCQFDVLSRSPILHIPSNAGSRGHAAEMLEYSQGTSSDGHISAHDMDDESMYSDDASIVNTALSRFASSRPDMGISSYETTSSHPHMELHRHLPPISHNQHPHSHSSSLAQLHAYNLAQLAKTNSTESRPHYSPMLSPDQDLTPTDDTIRHTTISTQSSIHTPTAAMNHMGMPANSKHQHINGRQNFAHPLVMPDAFPRDPPDVHRFPMGSFGDYGEASTYASTELDEALGFNEAEPGIISLTATDYDDDTQL